MNLSGETVLSKNMYVKKPEIVAYTASICVSDRCIGLPSHAVRYMDLQISKMSYYQILVDSSSPNIFWIKGISKYESGSRVFTLTHRRLSCFDVENLFVDFGVNESKLFHCLAIWDSSLQAIKVDMNNRVSNKKRVHREVKVKKTN